jgi:hypothetical protein
LTAPSFFPLAGAFLDYILTAYAFLPATVAYLFDELFASANFILAFILAFKS